MTAQDITATEVTAHMSELINAGLSDAAYRMGRHCVDEFGVKSAPSAHFWFQLILAGRLSGCRDREEEHIGYLRQAGDYVSAMAQDMVRDEILAMLQQWSSNSDEQQAMSAEVEAKLRELSKLGAPHHDVNRLAVARMIRARYLRLLGNYDGAWNLIVAATKLLGLLPEDQRNQQWQRNIRYEEFQIAMYYDPAIAKQLARAIMDDPDERDADRRLHAGRCLSA